MSITSCRHQHWSPSLLRLLGVLAVIGALSGACVELFGGLPPEFSRAPSKRPTRPSAKARAAARPVVPNPQSSQILPPPPMMASAGTVPAITSGPAAMAVPPADSAAAVSTAALAAALTSETLANELYRIVAATEAHDPALAKFDSQVKQLDAEMQDIRFSVGWEIELVKQTADYDANRRSLRKGTALASDGQPRRAFDFFDHYDRTQQDFIVRLKRSFLGPDHEKYVRIGARRIEKMDLLIAKQKIRRETHIKTLQAILNVLYHQTATPLIDSQIALTSRQIELLKTFQKAGEALRKDVLGAEKELRRLEEQRLVSRNLRLAGINELRLRTGDRNLTLPTTLPLVANSVPTSVTLVPAELSSYALMCRTDYQLAERRLDFAGKMATYMAWYWPRLDFEVDWDKYTDRRTFVDTRRRDQGKQYSTEITLNLPLNLPYRSWKRHEEFRAVEERYAFEKDQIRQEIENDVLRAYSDLQLAYLHHTTARAALEHAIEDARQTALVAQQLPEEIQGIAEIKTLDAQLRVVDARLALCAAEHQLLLAQALWDYQTGDSPIVEALEPYEERDLQAAEKKVWVTWWTSLTK